MARIRVTKKIFWGNGRKIVRKFCTAQDLPFDYRNYEIKPVYKQISKKPQLLLMQHNGENVFTTIVKRAPHSAEEMSETFLSNKPNLVSKLITSTMPFESKRANVVKELFINILLGPSSTANNLLSILDKFNKNKALDKIIYRHKLFETALYSQNYEALPVIAKHTRHNSEQIKNVFLTHFREFWFDNFETLPRMADNTVLFCDNNQYLTHGDRIEIFSSCSKKLKEGLMHFKNNGESTLNQRLDLFSKIKKIDELIKNTPN